MTIYLMAGAVAGLVLAVILVIRDVLERRRAYWEQRWQMSEDETEGTTLARLAAAQQPRGLMERIDRSFATMIRRTGLNITPEQAVGFMVLAGVITAGALA